MPGKAFDPRGISTLLLTSCRALLTIPLVRGEKEPEAPKKKQTEATKEADAIEEKPPKAIEKKEPENFMGTMRRWFKFLDSPIGLVVTWLVAVYFSAIEWRVNFMVRDPDFMAQLKSESDFLKTGEDENTAIRDRFKPRNLQSARGLRGNPAACGEARLANFRHFLVLTGTFSITISRNNEY